MKIKHLSFIMTLGLASLTLPTGVLKADGSCLSVFTQTKQNITFENNLQRPISFIYQSQRYALQPQAKKIFSYEYTAPRCSTTLEYPVVSFDQKSFTLNNVKIGNPRYLFRDSNGEMDLSFSGSDRTSPEEYLIQEYYRMCLGRAVESKEAVSFWQRRVNAKAEICSSDEARTSGAQGLAVDYAYQKCLGRAVESISAKNAWVDAAKNSGTLSMIDGVCNSPEANLGLNN